MITMIFEKTLARKIIISPKKAETETRTDTHANGDLNGSADVKSKWTKYSPQTLLSKAYQKVKYLFVSKAEVYKPPESASMGKIMNIMR